MRWLFAVCSLASILAAQDPIISVKATQVLDPGREDIVVPIDLKPSVFGGDWFIMMMNDDGVTLELELPDGRRIKQATALDFDMDWRINGRGEGMAILVPGMYAKVNHNLIWPAGMPAGQYRIHAGTASTKTATLFKVMMIQGLGGAHPVRIEAHSVDNGPLHYSGDRVEIRIRVLDHDRLIFNPTVTGSATTIPAPGKPSRNPLPLTVRAAGDGTLLTTLPWTEAGDYRVSLAASGKRLNGEDFHEGMSYTESIQQLRIRLLGITDSPGIPNKNGESDHIAVAVRLKVGLAGRYSIRARIDGQLLFADGSKEANLAQGESTVVVDVPFGGYSRPEKDGPYMISVGIDGLYERPLTAPSRPYQRSSFSR